MTEQSWEDKWEGKVSIPCPSCGKTAVRVNVELAEKGELVGLTCQHCGNRFDFEHRN